MGSSPEMERFGMMDSEMAFCLNPENRYGKRPSKKQQIYGIWASDSDSDDASSSTMTGKRKKGKDYTGPINFISGGVKGGSGPPKDKPSNSPGHDLISDDEEEISRYREEQQEEADIELVEPLEEEPVKQSASSSRRRGKNNKDTKFRNTPGVSIVGDNVSFGGWERHTKGIGMKLLEKMGYQSGKGLGPEAKGIVTPVQAVKREGKVAVGYYGAEKPPSPKRGDKKSEPEDHDRDQGTKLYKKTKDAPGKLEKTKYIYKTASEIISDNSTPGSGYLKKKNLFLKDSAMSKVKVVDMTGKEQRVYSGYHHLTRVSAKMEEDDEGIESSRGFSMPVLLHNLDLLVADAEDEIIKADHKNKTQGDAQVNYRHQIQTMEKICDSEEKELLRLRTALDLISRFHDRVESSSTPMDPEEAAQWIRRAREECGDMPEMGAVIIAMARPLMAHALNTWNPLEEPRYALGLLTEWQQMVAGPDVFDSLLQSAWLPRVRSALQSHWQPRNSESLFQLLEAWRPLLSDFMLNCLLLNQLIYPKLQAEVERWNPLTDTVPIHSWLHPWLPWLGDQLAPAHDLVRHKLGSCLSKWHPSDASAHAILLPWQPVFTPSEMTAFIRRHILPKLELCLKEMQVSPTNQNMSPWEWVMRWNDLIPPAMLADLIEHQFLPKWLTVLGQWLVESQQATTQACYAEIGRWYAWWRGQIPPQIADYPGVRHALQKALQAMERTLNGQSPLDVLQPVIASEPGAPAIPTSFVPTNLKELIEKRAAENGHLFHPVPSRFYQGKQIYRLGMNQIYMDRNVIFFWNNIMWQPISITDLFRRTV